MIVCASLVWFCGSVYMVVFERWLKAPAHHSEGGSCDFWGLSSEDFWQDSAADESLPCVK